MLGMNITNEDFEYTPGRCNLCTSFLVVSNPLFDTHFPVVLSVQRSECLTPNAGLNDKIVILNIRLIQDRMIQRYESLLIFPVENIIQYSCQSKFNSNYL